VKLNTEIAAQKRNIDWKQKRPLVYLAANVNLPIGHATEILHISLLYLPKFFSAFAVDLKSDKSHLCSCVTARYSVHVHATHCWSQRVGGMMKPSQFL